MNECALVGVLIKYLYETHGAKIKQLAMYVGNLDLKSGIDDLK